MFGETFGLVEEIAIQILALGIVDRSSSDRPKTCRSSLMSIDLIIPLLAYPYLQLPKRGRSNQIAPFLLSPIVYAIDDRGSLSENRVDLLDLDLGGGNVGVLPPTERESPALAPTLIVAAARFPSGNGVALAGLVGG
jgi:hypothetical protein